MQLLNVERRDRVQGATGNPEGCFARGPTDEAEKDGARAVRVTGRDGSLHERGRPDARAGDLPGAWENTEYQLGPRRPQGPTAGGRRAAHPRTWQADGRAVIT